MKPPGAVRGLIDDSGLERVDVDDPMQTSNVEFVGGVPPAEKPDPATWWVS